MITAKEVFLLELLGRGEHYGSQLVRRSRGRIRNFQIYGLLARLIQNDLVTVRPEATTDPDIAIPRLLYRRTEKGTRLIRRVHHAPKAPSTQEAIDGAIPTPAAPLSGLAVLLIFLALVALVWGFSR